MQTASGAGPVLLVALFRTPPDDQTVAFAVELAASGAGTLILVDSATAPRWSGALPLLAHGADRKVRASFQRAAANALRLGLRVEGYGSVQAVQPAP